jgi:hypothetical protein
MYALTIKISVVKITSELIKNMRPLSLKVEIMVFKNKKAPRAAIMYIADKNPMMRRVHAQLRSPPIGAIINHVKTRK